MSCDWPIDRTCLPALPVETDPTYEQKLAQRNAAEDLAVQVLWSLSGRQFGACSALVRPCPNQGSQPMFRPGSPYDQSVSPFVPSFEFGRWVNYPCGCLGSCRKAGPRTVHLPGPVVEIVTVTIGDVVLDPDEYALEGDVLYRKGGNWPTQDYNRPMGETNTWSVEYTKGVPVPEGVGVFVGQLANEFLAACSGDACRLPRNVVSVTNRGVSRAFDPSAMYAYGKTGMTEIDLWLSAVNPYHVMSRPSVV